MQSPSPKLTGGVGDGAGVGIGWGSVLKHNNGGRRREVLVINCAAKESRTEQSLAGVLGAVVNLFRGRILDKYRYFVNSLTVGHGVPMSTEKPSSQQT